MLSVATDYFGLTQDSRLKVVIDDGIEFLKKAVKMGQSYKAVLFDVDSKDSTVGMSCPPVQFLSQEVLDAVKACIKDNGIICESSPSAILITNREIQYCAGIFVLNLVCRDDKLRDDTIDNLKKSFKTVVSYKLEEDVNEILYCQNTEHDSANWMQAMTKSVKSINELLSREQNSLELIEVEDFIQDLKL